MIVAADGTRIWRSPTDGRYRCARRRGDVVTTLDLGTIWADEDAAADEAARLLGPQPPRLLPDANPVLLAMEAACA